MAVDDSIGKVVAGSRLLDEEDGRCIEEDTVSDWEGRLVCSTQSAVSDDFDIAVGEMGMSGGWEMLVDINVAMKEQRPLHQPPKLPHRPVKGLKTPWITSGAGTGMGGFYGARISRPKGSGD